MPLTDAVVSARFSVEALRLLSNVDYRLLVAVERGMINHEYVSLELIASLAGVGGELAERRMRRLHALGLVQRVKAAYTGYVLTSRGYDCLAFRVLAKRGVLEAISQSPVGEGKESEVYLGLTPGGRLVAVKVHRVGRTSFRSVKKVRLYAAGKRHTSWLYQSRLAARSEYEALRLLWKAGVSVPEPIDWNRHVVVTGYVEGVELSEGPELEDPGSVLERALAEVEKAYRAGVVHGDLSEYNVLVVEGEKVVLIDWPQWVSSSHPQALTLLKRDVENLAAFFARKYGLKLNAAALAEEFLTRVAG
ncbi:MAG: RIO1 family regulatory kinase/ATPase [Thermofilum sp.]